MSHTTKVICWLELFFSYLWNIQVCNVCFYVEVVHTKVHKRRLHCFLNCSLFDIFCKSVFQKMFPIILFDKDSIFAMLLNSYIILMKKIWHYLVENAQTEMYPLFLSLHFSWNRFRWFIPVSLNNLLQIISFVLPASFRL